MRWG